MSILFLACLLAICLPILSVQLPRFLPHLLHHLRTSSTTPQSLSNFQHPKRPSTLVQARIPAELNLENRSPLHKRPPPLRRRLRPQPQRPIPAPRSSAQHGRREALATDGADSGALSTGEESGEWTGSEEIHRQPPHPTATSGLLKVEREDKGKMAEKGKGRADGKEYGRKPWDPPFGRRREGGGENGLKEKEMVGNAWFVSPPTPPKKTGRELEAKGVARRLFPRDGEGEFAYDREMDDGILESDREDTPRLTPTPMPTPAPGTGDYASMNSAKPVSAKKKGRSKPGVMSAVWICVGILVVLVFILAFAILVAHCLAWFLVYKTEARLGDARRGILQGGDMRLCLCAT